MFAVEQISKVIGSGRYAPGERLVEADFERELGLGRVPVREALRILAGDGVVELIKNRGARIPIIELDRLVEMLQVQDALIRFALEEMVTRPNYDLHLQRLSEQTRKLRERLEANDVRGVLRGMVRYHMLVVEASGNEYLKNITRRHYLYHHERHVRDLAPIELLARAVSAYEEATEALHQRDAERAYQCMRLKNYDFIAGLKAQHQAQKTATPSLNSRLNKKQARARSELLRA
jgi:DNA-binding GntR family transcriptional regulator